MDESEDGWMREEWMKEWMKEWMEEWKKGMDREKKDGLREEGWIERRRMDWEKKDGLKEEGWIYKSENNFTSAR